MLSALVLLTVSVSVACVLALGALAFASRRKKAGAGEVSVAGCVGSVVEPLRPEGAVLVRGELWRARSRTGAGVARGSVRVVGASGHLLEVEPVD